MRAVAEKATRPRHDKAQRVFHPCLSVLVLDYDDRGYDDGGFEQLFELGE